MCHNSLKMSHQSVNEKYIPHPHHSTSEVHCGPQLLLTQWIRAFLPFFHRCKLLASQNILATSTVGSLAEYQMRSQARQACSKSNEQRAHTYLRTRGLPSRLLGDFANKGLYQETPGRVRLRLESAPASRSKHILDSIHQNIVC